MKFLFIICIFISQLVSNVKSKEIKDLNVQALATNMRNKTDNLEVQILEFLEPELNSDKFLDIDQHQATNYHKRHIKRKRKVCLKITSFLILILYFLLKYISEC